MQATGPQWKVSYLRFCSICWTIASQYYRGERSLLVPLLRQQAGSWQFHNDENKIEGPCFFFSLTRSREITVARAERVIIGAVRPSQCEQLTSTYSVLSSTRRKGQGVDDIAMVLKCCSVVETRKTMVQMLAVGRKRQVPVLKHPGSRIPLGRLTRASRVARRARGAGEGRPHASG